MNNVINSNIYNTESPVPLEPEVELTQIFEVTKTWYLAQ